MILVIDLEATCSDDGSMTREQMEVIELGAVWATPAGVIINALQCFVRPVERPILKPFCMALTHIEQAQIERENAQHGLPDPLAGLPHINLKAAFAKAPGIKRTGMPTALPIAGIQREGEHHRALSDARNIARLLPFCRVESTAGD